MALRFFLKSFCHCPVCHAPIGSIDGCPRCNTLPWMQWKGCRQCGETHTETSDCPFPWMNPDPKRLSFGSLFQLTSETYEAFRTWKKSPRLKPKLWNSVLRTPTKHALQSLPVEFDAISYAAQSPERSHQLGGNPAQLLAQRFSEGLQLPVLSSELLAKKSLDRSHACAEARRSQELLVLFDPEIQGKRLLLVDDLRTTGGTLRSLSIQALRQGAQSVHAVAWGRAPADLIT